MIRAAAALLLLAACSAPAPAPPPAKIEARRAGDDAVVALYDGRPITWRQLAERSLDLELKYLVDQYVRWKIVDDRRTALGIHPSPDEMGRRAEAVARATREKMGAAAFEQQLKAEGFTEESYRKHMAGSRLLAETFVLEQIVRYEQIAEDSIEVDRMVFAEEEEARAFAARAREKGFDVAAGQEITGPRKRTAGRIPRESFARTLPPADPPLDPETVETLFKSKKGDLVGPAAGRAGLHSVILVLDLRGGRKVDFADVRGEILNDILRRPPSSQEIRRWIEREFSRIRIEYRGLGPIKK